MTKTQKNTQSNVTTETAAVGNAGNVTPIARPNAGASIRSNAFLAIDAKMSAEKAKSLEGFSAIRQKLAEAADLFKEGGQSETAARKVADEATGGLYQALHSGAVNMDQVNAALGDTFGYVSKKDGTPGKTPDGQGSAIRKRVVRAVQAVQAINGEDSGAFFAGLEPDSKPDADKGDYTLADVVNGVNNGTLSIWTAYDRFGYIRSNNLSRLPMIFDPAKIAAMQNALTGENVIQTIASSQSLIAAFGGLLSTLNVIGEEVGKLVEAGENEVEAA